MTSERFEEIVAELRVLRTELDVTKAALVEARKQPVRVLPEITMGIISDWHNELDGSLADQMNRVLRRRFRQADAKPALDVDEIGQAISNAYYYNDADGKTISGVAAAVLREHFKNGNVSVKPALDVEAVAREIVDEWRTNWQGGITTLVQRVLRKYVTDEPLQKTQQLPDETLAAVVARVERETRKKCADELRQTTRTIGEPSRSYLENVADFLESGE